MFKLIQQARIEAPLEKEEQMTRKMKENPIPADLMAMGLADLQRLQGQRGGKREEFFALVEARDKAQAALESYTQRDRDIERALTVKLKEAIESQKAAREE